MVLTPSEEIRIQEIEQTIRNITKLATGAGSKNQLNRLLVLAQEQVADLKNVVEPLEVKMEELLVLARKLQ